MSKIQKWFMVFLFSVFFLSGCSQTAETADVYVSAEITTATSTQEITASAETTTSKEIKSDETEADTVTTPETTDTTVYEEKERTGEAETMISSASETTTAVISTTTETTADTVPETTTAAVSTKKETIVDTVPETTTAAVSTKKETTVDTVPETTTAAVSTKKETTANTTSETTKSTTVSTEKSVSNSNSNEENYNSVDYYSYYDPINNRTNYIPGSGIYIHTNRDEVKRVYCDPSCMDYSVYLSDIEGNGYTTSDMFLLKNNIFYLTKKNNASSYSPGLNRFDLETGETYEVVPKIEIPCTPEFNPISGEAYYMLSNDCKIYGIIPTYKKQPIQSKDGEIEVEIEYSWKVIRVNDDYSGYKVIGELDPDYDYALLGVYDSIIYLEKYTEIVVTGYSGWYGTLRTGGEPLGIYSYNINNGKETKLFDPLPDYSSLLYVIEYKGKLAFCYIGHDDGKHVLYLNVENSGWKEILKSPNSNNQFWFGYNGVQYTNNKFYIPLSDGEYSIYYSADNRESEYIGISQSGVIVVENDVTGKTQYVNQNGELLDFE